MEWENLRDKIDYAPGVAPSELFRRQVIATFEEEALAYQYIPHLGADSCMWAADFPHTDSTFPESRRSIEETLGMLPTRIVARSPRSTAPGCTASSMSSDAEEPAAACPAPTIGRQFMTYPDDPKECVHAS